MADTKDKDKVRRDYIARLEDGDSVERKTDFGLSEAFERIKGKTGAYITDRKYLNGYVKGHRDGIARIALLWVDGKGGRGYDRFEFEHYFWVETACMKGRALSMLRKWRDGLVGAQGHRSRVRRWETDPDHPQWTKVYVDCPQDYFYTRSYLADRQNHYVSHCNIDGSKRRIQSTPPSYRIAEALEARGVRTFEADLNPIRRFVADVPVNYPDSTDFSESYFDIETDDRHDDTFDELGKYRILSICSVSKDGTSQRFLLTEDTDEAERKMLTLFRNRVLAKTDVLASWNGYNFDYFYLYKRMLTLGVEWKWWEVVFCDLLPVFKRYHFRAGSKNTSMALGNIGRNVLGDAVGAKVDIKKVLDERYPGWRQETGSQAGTWAAWLYDPDLLLDYNEQDCAVLSKLEAFCGYGHLDFTFSKIGNCFANDYHISTKVDGLMVRKGKSDGVHFPTIIKAEVDEREEDDDASYEGGYVHEPERGVHHEVVDFDFKSLYPSMMTTFNISPDTFVSEAARAEHDPAQLISTPIGTTFVRPKKREDGTWADVGFIPQMFVETLERRKTYTNLQATQVVGSDMFLHYYRLAYSYKRLGLSFYGELGNKRGRYFNPEIARSVTLSGQHFIKETMKFSKEVGHMPLYGDTDSMFIQLDRNLAMTFVGQCQEMYFSWLDSYNAPRERCSVELEYEDVFGTICLINKKRYFGRLVYHKGQDADHLEVKGLEFMRSDGLDLGRRMQERVMLAVAPSIASGKGTASSQEVWDMVCAERARVLAGGCTWDELCCVSGLTKDPRKYAAKPPHVQVVERMRLRGEEWYVGMKVAFVWIKGTYVPRPVRERDESESSYKRRIAYWQTQEDTKAKRCSTSPRPFPASEDEFADMGVPYDAEFYWNEKVYPPSLRVLEVAYPDRDWKSLDSYEVGRRRRTETRAANAVVARDKLMARYRKGLLSSKTRDATVAKISSDAKLDEEMREELSDFYLMNVLCASGVG